MSLPINDFADLDDIDIKDLFYYGKNTNEQHTTENTSNVIDHSMQAVWKNVYNDKTCEIRARSYSNTPSTSSSDSDIEEWTGAKELNKMEEKEEMEYNTGQKRCKNCKTIDTPLWRWNERGQILCNACRLYEVTHAKARPLTIQREWIGRANTKHVNTKCGNCGIRDSQGLQWRKVDDVFYCNACGLYLKKHGKQRSLRKAGGAVIRRTKVKTVGQ